MNTMTRRPPPTQQLFLRLLCKRSRITALKSSLRFLIGSRPETRTLGESSSMKRLPRIPSFLTMAWGRYYRSPCDPVSSSMPVLFSNLLVPDSVNAVQRYKTACAYWNHDPDSRPWLHLEEVRVGTTQVWLGRSNMGRPVNAITR